MSLQIVAAGRRSGSAAMDRPSWMQAEHVSVHVAKRPHALRRPHRLVCSTSRRCWTTIGPSSATARMYANAIAWTVRRTAAEGPGPVREQLCPAPG